SSQLSRAISLELIIYVQVSLYRSLMQPNTIIKIRRSTFALSFIVAILFNGMPVAAQTAPLAPRVADTIITIWKDYPGATANRPARWSYEQGVVLKGI